MNCRTNYLVTIPPSHYKYLEASDNPIKKLLKCDDFILNSDKDGIFLGSGGGAIYALLSYLKSNSYSIEHIDYQRNIVINMGGKSTRLPSYASLGKGFIPMPLDKTRKGGWIDQLLLYNIKDSLEALLFRDKNCHYKFAIVSGDVWVDFKTLPPILPLTDVLCIGAKASIEQSSKHGVFIGEKNGPYTFKVHDILQKPSEDVLLQETKKSDFCIDTGIWLLSSKALKLLLNQVLENEAEYSSENVTYYDFYSEFGQFIDQNQAKYQLSVEVLYNDSFNFFHFGTSLDLINSTQQILLRNSEDSPKSNKQNLETVFTLNSHIECAIGHKAYNIWVENCYLDNNWHLTNHNILTNIPKGVTGWSVPSGICVDVLPVGQFWGIRVFNIEDTPIEFNKRFAYLTTSTQVLSELGKLLTQNEITHTEDPKIEKLSDSYKKVAFDLISEKCNFTSLYSQKFNLLSSTLNQLRNNIDNKFFLNLDYNRLSLLEREKIIDKQAPITPPNEEDNSLNKFEISCYNSSITDIGKPLITPDKCLQEIILEKYKNQEVNFNSNILEDQIIWSRSPIRIDFSGGWTDTPPYCIYNGGNVVNAAINLNGQEPIQVFIKRIPEKQIVLTSIDLGEKDIIKDEHDLKKFHVLGSPFSIPKAALTLCGFSNDYNQEKSSFKEKLEIIKSGFEITILSCIPMGSGLGTSSIITSTLLGALSRFLGLNWSKAEIGERTLAVEQLLTSGGGWQDQFGGLYHGIKTVYTSPSIIQRPDIKWLPQDLFTHQDFESCHLLYYTGITRRAKNILGEIVKDMFLNKKETYKVLSAIKQNSYEMQEAISNNNFTLYGNLVKRSWSLNKKLDPHSSSKNIEAIISLIDDLSLGYKLPGAGGGGYLYIVAKDQEAQKKIRTILLDNKTHKNARFTELSLSSTGLTVTTS